MILIDTGTRFGASYERRACRYCGKVSVVTVTQKNNEEQDATQVDMEPQTPVYQKGVCCPECGSSDTVVQSTRKRFRWHHCRSCSVAFKTSRD